MIKYLKYYIIPSTRNITVSNFLFPMGIFNGAPQNLPSTALYKFLTLYYIY